MGKHSGKPRETKPFEPVVKPTTDGSKGGGGSREKPK